MTAEKKALRNLRTPETLLLFSDFPKGMDYI